MVELMLAGGLGNQMFQYAYARAISEEFKNSNIEINPYFNEIFKIYSKAIKGKPEYLEYQLNLFKLNSNVKVLSSVAARCKALKEFSYGTAVRMGWIHPNTDAAKYEKKSSKGKFVLFDKSCTYYRHSKDCSVNRKTVLGWFFSEKFFANIKPILLEEFQFKEPPADNKNIEMIEELSSCNSVCVHIRRGDLTNKHYTYFSMVGEDYYKEGMRYIAERTNNPVFYIFTNNHNDFEWLKQNYKFDYPVKFVDLGNPGHEDLRLMYNCKHFVISNSSFSWWGSYMSQNPNKIVVAPDLPMDKCWLGDKSCKDKLRSDMVILKADKEERK